MKAIIVKNNEFETIGFEVSSNSKTLFCWGISSYLKSNFQKEIDTKKWMAEIFELVALQNRIDELRDFSKNVFFVLSDNNMLEEGTKINFRKSEEYRSSLVKRMEKIINSLN